jgi:hypothetical protein
VTESEGLHFTLLSGKPAQVIAHSGKTTVLSSPESGPPGSTVRGEVDGISGPLEVKVRSCKRTQDGVFRIEGRLQNARKELLAVLTPLPDSGG